jgi:hypothetical protein
MTCYCIIRYLGSERSNFQDYKYIEISNLDLKKKINLYFLHIITANYLLKKATNLKI